MSEDCVLVTGYPGVGKTTAINLLRERGVEAGSADDYGIYVYGHGGNPAKLIQGRGVYWVIDPKSFQLACDKFDVVEAVCWNIFQTRHGTPLGRKTEIYPALISQVAKTIVLYCEPEMLAARMLQDDKKALGGGRPKWVMAVDHIQAFYQEVQKLVRKQQIPEKFVIDTTAMTADQVAHEILVVSDIYGKPTEKSIPATGGALGVAQPGDKAGGLRAGSVDTDPSREVPHQEDDSTRPSPEI
jgi:hypothetical protein